VEFELKRICDFIGQSSHGECEDIFTVPIGQRSLALGSLAIKRLGKTANGISWEVPKQILFLSTSPRRSQGSPFARSPSRGLTAGSAFENDLYVRDKSHPHIYFKSTSLLRRSPSQEAPANLGVKSRLSEKLADLKRPKYS
jgi:hypothetical protein